MTKHMILVDAVKRSLGRLARLLGPTALVAFCLLSFAAKTLAATYHCSSAGGVTTAMSKAQPGDILILAAGSYGSMTFSGNGSEGNPITLRAERHGAVTLTGQLAVSGSWLTADGFTLTGAGWITIAGHHHRITNMDVNGSSAAHWVQLDSASQYCEIDHCLFRNKSVAGQLLQLRGSSSSAGHYHSIHHNYFRDFAYGGGANGWETIQFGQGATSTATWSANTVASNLFFQCDGEGEIVSAKNSGNRFLGNVFRKCRGKLVIRMGHRCRMEGNYFFGDGGVNTGGIRISGENHEIVNNTFHDLSATALVIMAGIDNDYLPVTNALVAFNTFAACADPVKIGSGSSPGGPHEPPEYTMANNVLFDTSGAAITYETNNMDGDPVATYEGNVVDGALEGLDPVPSGIDTNTAPDMVVCTNEAGNRYPGWIFAPDSDSPLVDAATGTYASVTSDLFGTMRVEPKDIGAVEGTTNAPLRLPVTTNDVGPVPIFVHAGADAACFATYTLTGSVVDMGLAGGAGLTNEWVLLDGDGDVQFDDASSATTRVTFAQSGTYVLRLTAWSGSTTNSDEITLVVDDSLSIVNTGASGVTSNSADLVGLLNCPNREFTVTVYWSTNDNADAAAWLGDGDAQSMEIGTYSNFTGQAVSGSVSSLTPNATYYYTMAATNGATSIWASPNVSFSTAALVITVTENGGNVDFAWNGIIGASGTTITGSTGGSADQIVPINGQIQVANGHVKFSEGQWYAGTASAYGSGEAFSEFIVTCNIPFHVNPDGSLRVGKIGGDAGSTFPDLSTQVFTGSFSLPGDFSTYGLFDTGPTALPLTLWTATTGGGSIVFKVADTDGDGLPGLWEDEHFGNDDGTPTPGELAESDGSGDFDGDGTSDLTEFRLGLIPTDATSAFTLDVSPGGAADTVELSWPSQEGLQFEIYFTDDLSLPLANWSVTPPITDGDDDGAPTHEWTDEDAASHPRRFYRVSLLQ